MDIIGNTQRAAALEHGAGEISILRTTCDCHIATIEALQREIDELKLAGQPSGVGRGCVREALQKWQRKYFSAGISHEMWPKAVEHAFEAGWTAALAAPAPKPAPPAEFPYNDPSTMEACAERVIGWYLMGELHEGDVKGLLDQISSGESRAAERKPPR